MDFPYIPGPLPDVHKAGDGRHGALISRFAGRGARAWQVARDGITVNETLVSQSVLNGVVSVEHNRIQWLVLVPPGVTDYSINIGRWIYATEPTARTKGYTFDRFVLDNVVTAGGAIDLLAYQRPERDPSILYIDGIAGVPAGPPPGIAKPNNPAPVPDGFVVLWRPADRE